MALNELEKCRATVIFLLFFLYGVRVRRFREGGMKRRGQEEREREGGKGGKERKEEI